MADLVIKNVPLQVLAMMQGFIAGLRVENARAIEIIDNRIKVHPTSQASVELFKERQRLVARHKKLLLSNLIVIILEDGVPSLEGVQGEARKELLKRFDQANNVRGRPSGTGTGG